MRCRRAAVLVVAGWLLMMPPPMNDKEWPDREAPIVKWTQESAHDTANECEVARAKQEDEALTASLKDPKSRPDIPRVIAMRCVPAEHVYPSK